jgi:radical SAM-linked protein
MSYTRGYHPKPEMVFAPALSLGVMSLDEYADVRLDRELSDADLADLLTRMNASSPAGLVFRGALRLAQEDATVTKVIEGARYLIAFARSALVGAAGDSVEAFLEERCRAAMAAASLPIRREIEGIGKMVDVRAYLLRAASAGPEELAALAHAGLIGDLVALDVDAEIRGSGAVKSSEIAAVIAGDGVIAPPHRAVRLELFGRDGEARFSPLDLARARQKNPMPTAAAAPKTATITISSPAAE